MVEELAKKIRNGVYKQTHIFDSVVGQLNTKEKNQYPGIRNIYFYKLSIYSAVNIIEQKK